MTATSARNGEAKPASSLLIRPLLFVVWSLAVAVSAVGIYLTWTGGYTPLLPTFERVASRAAVSLPASPGVQYGGSVCARQLTAPVLAYWLGLPSDRSLATDDSAAAAGGESLEAQLDAHAVVTSLRQRRRELSLQLRQKPLHRALHTWYGLSTAALPQLVQQQLRNDTDAMARIDEALARHSSLDASFWLPHARPLEVTLDATLEDATSLSLSGLVPDYGERLALSDFSPVLLAVPRLAEPYDRERSGGQVLDDAEADPFDTLASYFGGAVSEQEAEAGRARPSLRGVAARLLSRASRPSVASPSSRPVVYSNLTAAACAVVFVPHTAPRTGDAFPRWLDTGHGPDSLIASLNDEGFGFARSLDFVPVAHSDLSYPASLRQLPFPLPLLSDRWHEALQRSAALEPYVVELRYLVPLKLSWPVANSTGQFVDVAVPASVRIVVRVQPGLAVDFGWGVYASDVRIPSVSPAASTSPAAATPPLLRIDGYVDYRNYEWNAERYHTRLQRENLPFHFARNFSFQPTEAVDNTGRQAASPAAVSAVEQPLPVCTIADAPGYWASQNSSLASIGARDWRDMSALPQTSRGMSYFADTCVYRPIPWREALTCLAQRYPTIHWFGDSNSRRDVRALYTAGRWLDAKYSCEDASDLVVAGNVTGNVSQQGWPYPLPPDTPLFGQQSRAHFRLPGQPGEPLSSNDTTGAWLRFHFVEGLSGDGPSPAHYFSDGPADLLIFGLGSWEPMLFQWDYSTHTLTDVHRDQQHNVTRQLLDAAALIHQHYVVPNPNITLVYRTAPPIAEHRIQVDGRHYAHARIEAFKRRIVRVLKNSVIGERLKVWDTQQLYSYKLHTPHSEDGAEMCSIGHVGPVTIRTELNTLLHVLCSTSGVLSDGG